MGAVVLIVMTPWLTRTAWASEAVQTTARTTIVCRKRMSHPSKTGFVSGYCLPSAGDKRPTGSVCSKIRAKFAENRDIAGKIEMEVPAIRDVAATLQ
jgi:hypothetical protein